jgi:hypothetical protein
MHTGRNKDRKIISKLPGPQYGFVGNQASFAERAQKSTKCRLASVAGTVADQPHEQSKSNEHESSCSVLLWSLAIAEETGLAQRGHSKSRICTKGFKELFISATSPLNTSVAGSAARADTRMREGLGKKVIRKQCPQSNFFTW